MSIQNFLGWCCLLTCIGLYLSEGYSSDSARLINGMALGFFGADIYLRYRK